MQKLRTFFDMGPGVEPPKMAKITKVDGKSMDFLDSFH